MRGYLAVANERVHVTVAMLYLVALIVIGKSQVGGIADRVRSWTSTIKNPIKAAQNAGPTGE